MLTAYGVRQVVGAGGNVRVIRPERPLVDRERPPEQAFSLIRPTLIGKKRGKIGKLVRNVRVLCAERLLGNSQGTAIEELGLCIATLAHMHFAEIVGNRRCSNAV